MRLTERPKARRRPSDEEGLPLLHVNIDSKVMTDFENLIKDINKHKGYDHAVLYGDKRKYIEEAIEAWVKKNRKKYPPTEA